MPVAIHCEPVSEPHSRMRPSRHDGLPRHVVPRNDTGVVYRSYFGILAMTEPWSQGEAGSSQTGICK
jgi:hypothetical protein